MERDEIRLLSHLTQYRVRVSRGNGTPLETTVGRLMQACDGCDHQIAKDEAELELKQIGIKHGERHGSPGYWISTNHPALKRILSGTPWSAGWCLALGRLPGAVVGDGKAVRFAFGHVSKAAWLPVDAISGGDENGD
jgi:hypothetical protein